MRAFIPSLIMGLGFLFVFWYLANYIIHLIKNIKPTSKRIQDDLQELKNNVKEIGSKLETWDREDLALLSLNQLNDKALAKKGAVSKGIFTSIYQEPMVAYASKKYASKKPNQLIFAQTSKHEFAYLEKDNETQISINDKPLGVLKGDGLLYGADGKPFAKINRNKEAHLSSIFVNNREVASVVNPEKVDKYNPRAFDMLSPMNPEEETLLLSLGVLEMVKNGTK